MMKSILLLAAALLVTTGCSKQDQTTKVTGEEGKVLSLTVPGTTTVKQGGTEKITITVKREKFDDPITIKLENLPDGVKVKEGPDKLEKGTTEATYVLEATEKAPAEKGQKVKVTAVGGGMKAGPKEFTINVAEKK